jgi:hypothetical protein
VTGPTDDAQIAECGARMAEVAAHLKTELFLPIHRAIPVPRFAVTKYSSQGTAAYFLE